MKGYPSEDTEESRQGARRHPLLCFIVTWIAFLALTASPVAASGARDAPAPLLPPDAAPEEAQRLEDVESAYRADYLHLATGPLGAEHATYAWPFDIPLTMGHAIQSYQLYSSTASDAYFHHGIDMMVPNGTDVFNRSGGQVVNVENYGASDLYWEVAVMDPEGYIWQYHHIDKNTIPQAIKDKFAEYQADQVNGGFIAPDTYIGDVVYWTVVSYGKRFNHIHLNILAAGGAYLNPMEFHTPLDDTTAPEIQAIGLLQNNVVRPGSSITGDYGLYVWARDLVLDDVYWLPPYKVELSVDGGPVTTVWQFQNLPGGASDKTYVNDYYVYPPTCGNYSCRDFYIDLGFTTEGQRAFPTNHGRHSVSVTAYDYAGNSTSGSFAWTVGQTTFFDDFETTEPNYTWTRNPMGTDTASAGLWVVGNPSGTTSGGAKQLDVTYSGTQALVTDPAGGTSSNSDIDGGVTSVRSPDIVLPDTAALVLSFYSYFAHTTGASTADFFRVSVAEATPPAAEGMGPEAVDATVVWEEFGANANRNAAWTYHEANIGEFRGKTVYILIEAADGNPNTPVVEAAVDNVQVTLTLPLDVALASFSADPGADAVTVTWETVSETDNAGFNLYRGLEGEAERALLATIPSQAPGSVESRIYSYTDAPVAAGQTYLYWLEDVDLDGGTTLHGPVSVKLRGPNALVVSDVSAVRPDWSSAAWGAAFLATLVAGWRAMRSRRRR